MNYPPICDQSFLVHDKSGSPIDKAEVIALKSVQTGFWRVTSTTTSDGGAVLTLDEGDTYTATAVKSGYECVSCTKTFKPCIGRITFTLKETNMTYAHVYPHWKNPASNTEKDPGTYVQVYLQIRNDSNTAGYCYFGVNKNGAECGKHIYNVWLEPGAAKNLTTPCSFVMPNSRVTIEYFGGHADYIGPGGWHEDFSDTIYIDPKPPVITYCNQTVRTVDQNGKGITARLHLTNSRNVYQNTDSLGYTTFTNLQENRTHYISAEKTGYSGDSDTFKACEGTITLTLGKTCYCGDWIPRECVREGVRRYTRTCDPPGCSTEEKTILDDTCLTKGILWVKSIPVQDADIYINNIKQTYKTNQDFDVNPGTYTVRVSKTGYIEPSSQSVSITAGQTETLTFTLEEEAPPCNCDDWIDGECVSTTHRAQTRICTPLGCDIEYQEVPDLTCETAPPPPRCSEYTDEESCVLAGCSWYDGFCHEYAPVKCSDYKDAITCEANLCHWWAKDGTCHDIQEPTIGMIELINCIAEKEAEGKYEISADVTVKNLTDEDKRFYIALYDAVTDNHLGDEPDVFEPSERLVEAGSSKLFHIDTYGWPEASTTPSLRYDLWYAPILGINKLADSRTEDCTEKELGKILSITCTSTKEAENDYEIEAIVKFKNPDTILHLYKVELLDAKTGESKDHEPNIYEAGKEAAAGETSTIKVDTTASNCISPKIIIKLWETTGFKALVDEQEKDCSEAEESLFYSLISFLVDTFNITEPQAKLIVYGAGGLLALSFIMPMLRR